MIRSNHLGYVHQAARQALVGLISGLCKENVKAISAAEVEDLVAKSYEIGAAFCEKGRQFAEAVYQHEGVSPHRVASSMGDFEPPAF